MSKEATTLRDLLPPQEIRDAAEKVSSWMTMMGYKNWQLGGICDRRFAIFAQRIKDAADKLDDDFKVINKP